MVYNEGTPGVSPAVGQWLPPGGGVQLDRGEAVRDHLWGGPFRTT